MQILIYIILFFIFLFCLYQLIRDDYTMIRKNVSLEQVFDLVFNSLWMSLFFARIFYFLFHPISGNLAILFFSPNKGGLSLEGGILGGALALAIFGRYKRIPLGRLFDFFTLAFLFVLPLGFLLHALFLKRQEMVLALSYAGLYFVLTIFFMKFLYPKILNKSLKEGNLAILFLLFFSLASLFTSIVNPFTGIITVLSAENILLGGLFIASVALLIKQERGKVRKKVV